MTGIRTSAVFTPESTFGVTPGSPTWYRFPTGLEITYQPKNNMNEYREIGNKFIDRVVAGVFSGSGTVTFKLDYDCINFLGWVFESYSFDNTNKIHTFQKANGKRVKSASIRTKKLNRIVGGNKDEMVILKGCVCTDFQCNWGGRDAVSTCTVQFEYVNETEDTSNLSSTDWDVFYDEEGAGYSGGTVHPVEWACLNIGDDPVAFTESVAFGVSNSVSMIKGCGTRFYGNYNEGQANIKLTTTCYSYTPDNYYSRMYSGGDSIALTSPKAKNLQPIPIVKIKSSETGGTTEYSMTVTFTRVYVESPGSRSFNTGSRINDSPSLKATNFKIEINNANDSAISIWN